MRWKIFFGRVAIAEKENYYKLLLYGTIEKEPNNRVEETSMDRGKIVAIITGAISIIIAIAYLVIVQLIDFRGEMVPAPVSQLLGDRSLLVCLWYSL